MLKHEIYFTERDYLLRKLDYYRNRKKFLSPEELLLITKAYFIEQEYATVITICQKINPGSSSKVLFERQCLLFKASYLMEDMMPFSQERAKELTSILDEYDTLKAVAAGPACKTFHEEVMANFREFVRSINIGRYFIDILDDKWREGYTEYAKQQKFYSFPCFLLPYYWRNKQLKSIAYARNQSTYPKRYKYPGPINTFSIYNEIFELAPYESERKRYLNKLLFPGAKYTVVSRAHWLYLKERYNCKKAGSNILHNSASNSTVLQAEQPQYLIDAKEITRFYGLYGQYTNKNQSSFFETIGLLIRYNNEVTVIHLPVNSLPKRELLPQLSKLFGPGQLRMYRYNYKGEVNYKIAYPTPKNLLLFTQHLYYFNINLPQSGEYKQLNKLIRSYDLLPYSSSQLTICNDNQMVGLRNLGNTCYLDASLQCLVHTNELTNELLANEILMKINFKAADGELVCSYIDLLKKGKYLQKKSSLAPSQFKAVFGRKYTQFSGSSQEDAHEFLNFLLNSLHDELNYQRTTLKPKTLPNKTITFEYARAAFFEDDRLRNNSIITQLIRGYLYHSICCAYCNKEDYHFEMFLILSLPVPPNNEVAIDMYYIGCSTPNEYVKQYKVHLKDLNNWYKLFTMIRIEFKIPTDDYEIYLFLLNRITFKVNSSHYEPNYTQNTGISQYQLVALAENNLLCFYALRKTSALRMYRHLIEYKYEGEGVTFPCLAYVSTSVSNNNEALLEIVLNTFSDELAKSNGFKISSINIYANDNTIYPYTIVTYLKNNSRSSIILGYSCELNAVINERPDLMQCFYLHRKAYTIPLYQEWKCSNCKKVKENIKQYRIYYLNDIFIVSLKRFYRGLKNHIFITYPLHGLDLSPYSSVKSASYDLYCVILHFGSLNSGHYVSICNHQEKWYLYDDDKVQYIETDKVVSQDAYILFYSRRRK